MTSFGRAELDYRHFSSKNNSYTTCIRSIFIIINEKVLFSLAEYYFLQAKWYILHKYKSEPWNGEQMNKISAIQLRKILKILNFSKIYCLIL